MREIKNGGDRLPDKKGRRHDVTVPQTWSDLIGGPDKTPRPRATIETRRPVDVEYSRVKVPFEREEREELLTQLTVNPGDGIAEVHNPYPIAVVGVRIDHHGQAQHIKFVQTRNGLIMPIPDNPNSEDTLIGFFVGRRRVNGGGAVALRDSRYPSIDPQYRTKPLARQDDPTGDLASFKPTQPTDLSRPYLGAVLRQGDYPAVPLVTAEIDGTYKELLSRLDGIRPGNRWHYAQDVGLFQELGFDPNNTEGLFDKSHKDSLSAQEQHVREIVIQQHQSKRHSTGISPNRFELLVYNTRRDIRPEPNSVTSTDHLRDARTGEAPLEIKYTRGRRISCPPSTPSIVYSLAAAFPIQVVSEWDGI